MNIVVCVKQIPIPPSPASSNRDNTLDRSGKLILDESDSYGVEMALQLVDKAGGGEVTLVSMAPNNETSGLRTALAMGAAKAILVSDDALVGRRRPRHRQGAGRRHQAGRARPGPRRHRVERRLHGHRARADRRAPRPAVDHLRQGDRPRRRHRQGAAPDRGRLRRGRAPAARRRLGHRRRGRAPLPLVQGDHGGQVEAGRRAHARRPRHRRRHGRLRPAPARRSSPSTTPPPARPARSSRTTARPSPRSSRSSTASRSSEDRQETAHGSQPIWVYAEAADGKVSPLTLELLAKARTLGGTVEAVYGGDDADAVAGTLGAHGATKVLATGDLGGSLPGVPVASAIAGADRGRQRPRPHHVRHHLRRPRHRRPPVGGLDKPVITNNIDLEVSGDDVVVTEPVFGGTKLVKTKFTAGGPHLALVPPEVVRGRGVRRRRGRASRPLAITDAGQAKVTNRHVEEATGPEARRGRRRRLRWPWPRRGGQVRDDRGPGQAAQGARPAPPGPSSTPAGCPTATRSARPARS